MAKNKRGPIAETPFICLGNHEILIIFFKPERQAELQPMLLWIESDK